MIFVYLTLFTLNNVILPAKHRSTVYRYLFKVYLQKKMLNFSALSISDNYKSLTDTSKAVEVDKADTDEDHDNDLGDEEEWLNKSAEQTRTENDYNRYHQQILRILNYFY